MTETVQKFDEEEKSLRPDQRKCPDCGEVVTVVGYFLGPCYTHNPGDVLCLRNQLAQAKREAVERVRSFELLALERRQIIHGALIFLEEGMPKTAENMLRTMRVSIHEVYMGPTLKFCEEAPEAEMGTISLGEGDDGTLSYGVKYHREKTGAVVGKVWRSKRGGWNAKRIEFGPGPNKERINSGSLDDMLCWVCALMPEG